MIAPAPTPFLFDPAEADIPAILSDLNDPYTCLADVATMRETSLEALTLWMARPDIAARMSAIDSIVMADSRRKATNCLPEAIALLRATIRSRLYEDAKIPVDPRSLSAMEQRRQSHETGRRAVALLLRIIRFDPNPRAPRNDPRPPSTTGPATEPRRAPPTPHPQRLPRRTLPPRRRRGGRRRGGCGRRPLGPSRPARHRTPIPRTSASARPGSAARRAHTPAKRERTRRPRDEDGETHFTRAA